MTNGKTSPNELLPHLFRQEYAKMTAVLCRHFGLVHIEIAEDIASETFLKASESWAINGVPQNPTVWLYIVAKNKIKDHIKHVSVFEKRVKNAVALNTALNEKEFEFDHEIIEDSQLAMIFAVCNPATSTESQVCLALQILCGFSLDEIANAFLTKTETIKKRLTRARSRLRKERFTVKKLNASEMQQRLDTVLTTLYLLFNEGYFSKTSDHVTRKDLCSEAVRLMLLLVRNEWTKTDKTYALLALMCYQSSRLDARTNQKGETVLFEDQDRDLWDKSLIEKGNYYLVNACKEGAVTKYHLEAGIAYWHTTPAHLNKWDHILQLYDQLLVIDRSPITALNRLFAFAKVFGTDKAIIEAEKTEPIANSFYFELLGYLYAEHDIANSIYNYKKAVSLTKSVLHKNTLLKKIAALSQKQTSKSKDCPPFSF